MQIYLPIADLPVNILVLLGVGAAIGFIGGLFGVGGGFLMTPLLIFLGIPPSVAVATGTAQIAASSLTGAITYSRRGALDVKLGAVLVAGGIVGSLLGIGFFNQMRRIGQLELVISLSYVTLLGSVGALMMTESLRGFVRARRGAAPRVRKAQAHSWYQLLPLRVRFHRSQLYVSIIPVVALGVFIGFAGSLLGIGGGFLVVPALIYLFRVPTAVVIGTSQLQILFTMLTGTLVHAVTNQQVDIVLALILIIGGVVGAQFGVRAGQNLKAEHFRFFLAALILAVAMRFVGEIAIRPDNPYSLGAMEMRP